ncbi:hypothetical protein [Paraburkholderia sp. DGU8]|jgi:enoyl-[acyl-carrier-protein] reductase (NADH)
MDFLADERRVLAGLSLNRSIAYGIAQPSVRVFGGMAPAVE